MLDLDLEPGIGDIFSPLSLTFNGRTSLYEVHLNYKPIAAFITPVYANLDPTDTTTTHYETAYHMISNGWVAFRHIHVGTALVACRCLWRMERREGRRPDTFLVKPYVDTLASIIARTGGEIIPTEEGMFPT